MKVLDQQRWKVQLVELAWELSDLGFDSTVRLPPGRRPSLEIFMPSGRSGSTAPLRGRVSVFTWNRRRNQGLQVVDHVRSAFEKIGKGVTP
ncbi:hypothetical protein GCM10017600_66710 [Streptosporangium carneum]|uniref:Uncharacterized protein n=1 Tax=Streptosporangium carneum TaxID=47481 RepID=A0A9W6I717_9ACTN|nr:hypothetical protein GCM10017600_66710 [Streptosporangium carneum]